MDQQHESFACLQVYESSRLTGGFPDLGNTALKTLYFISKSMVSGTLHPFINPELTSYVLYSKRVSGTLSAANMAQLNTCTLDVNRVSGSIPKSWGRLQQLVVFDFRNNRLSGSIPEIFIPKLMYLLLSNLSISGSLSMSMGSLTELKGLMVSGLELSSSLPPSLSQIPNLTFVDLSDNNIGGDLTQLGNMLWNPSIRHLHLQNNTLSGTVQTGFLRYTAQLYSVLFHSNEISGTLSALSQPNISLAEQNLTAKNNCTKDTGEKCDSIKIFTSAVANAACADWRNAQCIDFKCMCTGQNECVNPGMACSLYGAPTANQIHYMVG